MNEKKKEMLQAEKLFDLPMSDYSNYDKAYKEFQGMEQIFAIYENQQVLKIGHYYIVFLYIAVLLIEVTKQFTCFERSS